MVTGVVYGKAPFASIIHVMRRDERSFWSAHITRYIRIYSVYLLWLNVYTYGIQWVANFLECLLTLHTGNAVQNNLLLMTRSSDNCFIVKQLLSGVLTQNLRQLISQRLFEVTPLLILYVTHTKIDVCDRWSSWFPEPLIKSTSISPNRLFGLQCNQYTSLTHCSPMTCHWWSRHNLVRHWSIVTGEIWRSSWGNFDQSMNKVWNFVNMITQPLK